MEDLAVADHPAMYRYAPSHGLTELVEEIARLAEGLSGIETPPEQVVVTVGATGGMASTLATLVSPGDGVLIPTPYWPLIHGITLAVHGRPIPVDGVWDAESLDAALAAMESSYDDRCKALFLNNPHNPTGRVLPPAWIEAIVDWARRRHLWILADDVYRDFVFAGDYATCRALAPERTFEIFSFSKAYGMAGNRCGYVVGPREPIDFVRRVQTHQSYGTAVASQLAALRILKTLGKPWLREALAQYRQVGREVAQILDVDPPASGLYLFIDTQGRIADDDIAGFHRACAEQGILLSPGEIFGAPPRFFRLCFASAPPDQMIRGARRLAELLVP